MKKKAAMPETSGPRREWLKIMRECRKIIFKTNIKDGKKDDLKAGCVLKPGGMDGEKQ